MAKIFAHPFIPLYKELTPPPFRDICAKMCSATIPIVLLPLGVGGHLHILVYTDVPLDWVCFFFSVVKYMTGVKWIRQ